MLAPEVTLESPDDPIEKRWRDLAERTPSPRVTSYGGFTTAPVAADDEQGSSDMPRPKTTQRILIATTTALGLSAGLLLAPAQAATKSGSLNCGTRLLCGC